MAQQPQPQQQMPEEQKSSLQQFVERKQQERQQDAREPQSAAGRILEIGGKALEAVRSVSDSPGAAPLWAMWRQGADESAQALKAFPESISPVSEMGQLFEPTPQLVTETMRGKEVDRVTDEIKAPENTGGVHGKNEPKVLEQASGIESPLKETPAPEMQAREITSQKEPELER